MNTLTILLVAAFAVVASGMKDGHPNDLEFHHTLHEGESVIGGRNEYILEAELTTVCLWDFL